MIDKNAAQSVELWPQPEYYFEVAWDDVVMSFQELSGLDEVTEPTAYRLTENPVFSVFKMPGIIFTDQSHK